MARTLLTDAEVATIASKTADEIERRRKLEEIELLKQVSRQEEELRKAKEQIEQLTTRNAFLQKCVNELTGSSVNGFAAFPTAGYPAVPTQPVLAPGAVS